MKKHDYSNWKRRIGLVFGLVLLFSYCSAQKGELKGRLVDSVGRKSTQYSIISVLRLSDSTLVDFTRSDADGRFILKGLPPGDFFLFVTHPQFSEQWMPVKIPDDTLVDLGKIFLPPRSSTLVSAIVIQRRPLLRLKGDTIEYDAANVKTKINASVEDLLKQLPGIAVDQKGGITAQGQKIQKILLDGEEFFSNDPTIATRNLSASMIDKVQILNKKSAQADFTGIDYGKTTKTINLTLREDSKHGFFGKAEAGTDVNHYYNSNALAGAFKAQRKLAAYGMASNTGQSGLNGADAQSFDDGETISVPSGPGAVDNFGASGAIGGVPQTKDAGIHYSNKFNGDGINEGQHLSGNYRFNSSLNNASSFTFTQQTLPDSVYMQTQQTNSFSRKDQHSLSGIYELGFDSSSSLRLSFGGLTDQGQNQDAFTDSTYLNKVLVNSSLRTSDAHIDNHNTIANILWRKKFSRPGQTFSADASLLTTDQHVTGFLYSLDKYYQAGSSARTADTTDQKKDISTHTSTLAGNMLYTTPLWKNWELAAGYSLAITQNLSHRNTWNKGSGKYNDYIDSLSSQYATTISTQRIRLTTQLKTQHFLYTFGGDLAYDGYRQTDRLADTSLPYHYLNLFPQMETRYNISPFRSLSLSYYGNTQQPLIYQLQPSKNNNDPLNVIIGNPGLQPAFTHSFGLSLNNNKPMAGKSLYVGINFGFTTNSICSRSLIDSLGRTMTQAINTNGNKNLGLYGYSSWDLHKLNLQLGLSTNLVYTRVVNYVNNLINFSDNYTPTAGFSISRNIADKYNFNINSNFGYTYSRNSINPEAGTHFCTESFTGEFGWSLPRQLDINTNYNYTWRQKINSSDNMNESLLWNAFLNKRLLKNGLTLRLTVSDILNQNKGLTSSISANQITETSFITLHRYWMLSGIWNCSYRGEARTQFTK